MSISVPKLSDVVPDVQRFLSMPKDTADGKHEYQWPKPGSKLQIELISDEDRQTKFFLDILENRRTSSVVISAQPERKPSFQTRASNRPYLRVDMADDPAVLVHRNPDGTLVEGNHVHLDIEGYGWGFAWPIGEQKVIVPQQGAYCVEGMFWALLELNTVSHDLRVNHSLGV